MKKISAGIIGGAGYTGGELLRILMQHPDAEILFVHSKSNSGKPVYTVHKDLFGETELVFSDTIDSEADILFLCLGHGDSRKFLEDQYVPDKTKIIDLSQDFRLNPNFGNRDFTYGAPELNKSWIQASDNIANPGCFATSIQLSMFPLAKNNLLKEDVHISGVTGSTGAGQSLSETTHFSWRNNNISTYKVFEHQHLSEINLNMRSLQQDVPEIFFVPYRGNFSRGILTTTYTKTYMKLQEITNLYAAYYEDHPFVHIIQDTPDLKYVVNTNKCVLNLAKTGSQLVITAAIDNLLKGASGQAVQNMNLMFGLPETAGLALKAMAF
jgi:N-acetyl-gamma-glutamyl-phosphate reductase